VLSDELDLPDPDAGDIFFDLESDPFAGNGGLEYLFGYAFRGTMARRRTSSICASPFR